MVENNLPTLVFIHHFGGNSGSWNWINKRFLKKYTCIFLNLPGFGKSKALDEISIRSMSEWIANEIRNLGNDNYILIGHAMGGKLALFTAFILHDLLPKKLILIAPSPLTKIDISDADKQRISHHLDKVEAEENVRSLINKEIKKSKFDYVVESQLEVDKKAWKWWLSKGKINDITWAIRNLEVPMYVITSNNDPVVTKETLQKEVFPYLNRARFISFGKSGHLIPIESSRKLVRVLKRIISE